MFSWPWTIILLKVSFSTCRSFCLRLYSAAVNLVGWLACLSTRLRYNYSRSINREITSTTAANRQGKLSDSNTNSTDTAWVDKNRNSGSLTCSKGLWLGLPWGLSVSGQPSQLLLSCLAVDITLVLRNHCQWPEPDCAKQRQRMQECPRHLPFPWEPTHSGTRTWKGQ